MCLRDLHHARTLISKFNGAVRPTSNAHERDAPFSATYDPVVHQDDAQ